jgi:hypothetical protein
MPSRLQKVRRKRKVKTKKGGMKKKKNGDRDSKFG